MILTSSGIGLIGPAPLDAAYTMAPNIETTRYSSGLPELDALLQGGYRRGSTTLISGAPGTAKSTLAAAFALSCAEAGRHALYVSFDETPEQIAAHAASVGFDVQSAVERGTLGILSLHSAGLPPEVHVERLLAAIDSRQAQALVIDPVSAILRSDHYFAARVVKYLLVELRKRSVTLLCTSLLEGTSTGITESTQSQVSTLADTWIHLSYVPAGGERNRALTIVKSRGTAHSNQVRELVLSDDGVALRAVYTADGDVLLGTARLQKEAADRRAVVVAEHQQKVREARAEEELDALASRVRDLERDLARRQQELRDIQDERQETLESEGADRRERVEARTTGRPTDDEHTQEQG
jgi:circadian clock protein KaiC